VPIGTDKLPINVQTGAVTSMAMSYDDSLPFITSKDGVLCVSSIRDKDNLTRNPEPSLFSTEVQTTKAEIDEKVNHLRTTEAERSDLEMSFKMKKEMIESTHKTKEA
jgi:hypothetical protein